VIGIYYIKQPIEMASYVVGKNNKQVSLSQVLKNHNMSIDQLNDFQLSHLIRFHTPNAYSLICDDPYCIFFARKQSTQNEIQSRYIIEQDHFVKGNEILASYNHHDRRLNDYIKLWDHCDYDSKCLNDMMNNGKRCHVIHWYVCHSPYATRKCAHDSCEQSFKTMNEFKNPLLIRKHLVELHPNEHYGHLMDDNRFDGLSGHLFKEWLYPIVTNNTNKPDDNAWGDSSVTEFCEANAHLKKSASIEEVVDDWTSLIEDDTSNMNMTKDVSNMTKDVSNMTKDVSNMAKDVSNMAKDVSNMANVVPNMENVVPNMENDTNSIVSVNVVTAESVLESLSEKLPVHRVHNYIDNIMEIMKINMDGVNAKDVVLTQKEMNTIRDRLMNCINGINIAVNNSNSDIIQDMSLGGKKLSAYMVLPYVVVRSNEYQSLKSMLESLLSKVSALEARSRSYTN